MRERALQALVAVVLPLLGGACAGPGAAEQPPHKQAIGTAGSGLYSAVVRSGNLLFLSGVIGRSAEEGIQGATRQALEGVRERLETAGATMADVVKCTVLLADIGDYGGMNEAYVQFFPSEPPARTAVAVQGLPGGARVEVECIAAVP